MNEASFMHACFRKHIRNHLNKCAHRLYATIRVCMYHMMDCTTCTVCCVLACFFLYSFCLLFLFAQCVCRLSLSCLYHIIYFF